MDICMLLLLLFVTILQISCEGQQTASSSSHQATSQYHQTGERRANSVMQLTAINFQDVLESSSYLFVQFYLPWCGVSMKSMAEFEEAAKELGGGATFARVDASKEPSVAKKHGVSTYPWFKFYGNGEAYDFDAIPAREEFVAFANRLKAPAVKEAKSLKEILEYLESEDVVLLSFSKPGVLDPSLVRTARWIQNQVHVLSVTDSLIHSRLEVEPSQLPVYILYRQGMESVRLEGSSRSAADGSGSSAAVESTPTEDEIEQEAKRILTFVVENYVKLVVEITHENLGAVLGVESPAVVMFHGSDRAQTGQLMRMMRQVAEKYSNFYQFGYLNGERFDAFAAKVAVKELPSVVIIDMRKEVQFVFPANEELNTKNLDRFIALHKSNKLDPSLRSAQLPSDNRPQNGISVAVADSLSHILETAPGDVLVNFESTWCGFCKMFASVFKDLGQLLASISSMELYSYDCDANDIDPKVVNVTILPTLALFPAANRSSVVMYNGIRDVDHILEWLNVQATHPFAVLTSAAGKEIVDQRSIELISSIVASLKTKTDG